MEGTETKKELGSENPGDITPEMEAACGLWARHWAKAMPARVIRRAVEREVMPLECVKDIIEEKEKAEKEALKKAKK